jgi:hypothetical protein
MHERQRDLDRALRQRDQLRAVLPGTESNNRNKPIEHRQGAQRLCEHHIYPSATMLEASRYAEECMHYEHQFVSDGSSTGAAGY